MSHLISFSITVLLIAISLPATAAETPESTLRCEYQTGYGESSFYLGYDFNLVTRNFENLVTLSSGQIIQTQDQMFNFIEATGEGSLSFGDNYGNALLTLSNLSNPVPFVLKCRALDPESVTTESRNFEILAEDQIDGEIMPTIEFMNYCGNDTVLFKVDLSKYISQSSPWYEAKFSLFGERSQFGPQYDCSPGERRRENFKVLNQLLNEARANDNLLKGVIRIRKEKFAPSGYSVRLELKSERLNKSFIFLDHLNAAYKQ